MGIIFSWLWYQVTHFFKLPTREEVCALLDEVREQGITMNPVAPYIPVITGRAIVALLAIGIILSSLKILGCGAIGIWAWPKVLEPLWLDIPAVLLLGVCVFNFLHD